MMELEQNPTMSKACYTSDHGATKCDWRTQLIVEYVRKVADNQTAGLDKNDYMKKNYADGQFLEDDRTAQNYIGDYHQTN